MYSLGHVDDLRDMSPCIAINNAELQVLLGPNLLERRWSQQPLPWLPVVFAGDTEGGERNEQS